MSGSTISTHVNEKITLGQGGYGNTLVVTNAGTVGPSGTSPGVAVYAGQSGQLISNAGLLIGGSGYEGVHLVNATLQNQGKIVGNSNAQFSVNAVDATIQNSGLIIGYGGANGVNLDTGYVFNSGTIMSAGWSYGASINDGATLVNAGTIIGGDSGRSSRNYAVHFGGAGALVIENGASFEGAVVGHGQTVLELAGTGSSALTGIGTEFTDFDQISFASGAAWSIAGNNSGLASGETISGFALGDAIILDSFAATSATFATGTGLILGNGSISETIDLTGSFTQSGSDALQFAANGGNTTITLGENTHSSSSHIIDSLVTTPVTLASPAYQAALTITGSGTVAPSLAGATAVTLLASAANTLLNQGVIAGSAGTGSANGGDGADLAGAGLLTNAGFITGGAGASNSPHAGGGGSGDVLGSGATLDNSGSISGGAGGTSTDYSGGGGDGIAESAGATLDNSGRITGGNGGTSTDYGGGGGTGVAEAASATLTNDGIITGGNGAYSSAFAGGGGDGISLSGSGLIINDGLIAGGDGAASSAFAGGGGTGVFLQGGTLVDAGTILAGAAGGTNASAGDAVQFGSLAATLIIDRGAVFAGAIANFGSTDTIELVDFNATSESFVSGTGLILSNGSTTETLDITGSFTQSNYEILRAVSDGTNTSIGLVSIVSGPTQVIDGLLLNPVTLADSRYLSPLTITHLGTVAATIAAATGVTVLSSAADTLINLGVVTGGMSNPGGTAGYGVSLAGAGTLINDGSITGGIGQSGTQWAGGGGIGVVLQNGGMATNSGLIEGGNGEGIEGGFNGGGGQAVHLAGASTLVNKGDIRGGTGSYGADGNVNGGAGAYLTNTAWLSNAGAISGGAGDYSKNFGGSGGAGADLKDNAFLTNIGRITGGAGGTGGAFGGQGGDGVDLTGNASLTNKGTIIGGAAGNGNAFPGHAGDGVSISGAGYLHNAGVIIGGRPNQGSAGAGVYLNGGTVVTSGTIEGGSANGKSIAGAAVQFGKHGGTLVLDPHAVLDGAVTGFAAGDTIVLAGFAATSETFSAGTGLILRSPTATETLYITGSFTQSGTYGLKAVSNGSETAITLGPLQGGIGSSPISMIGSLVTQSVTLGGGTFAAGLTIALAGTIAPTSPKSAALVSTLASAYLNNFGYVFGAAGAAGGTGGTAAFLSNSTQLNNNGTFTGGHGGANGGTGGTGLVLATGAVLVNSNYYGPGGPFHRHGSSAGEIFGGAGGTGTEGGHGGDGVIISSATLRDLGGNEVAGGNGGAGSTAGGAGGIGALVTNGLFSNGGTVTGGAGGFGASTAGAGGVGVVLNNATLIGSAGTISGGNGGQSGTARGGGGGDGIVMTNSVFVNDYGTVIGGAGGNGAASGGIGVYVHSGELITNGTIIGGNAGARAAVAFGGDGTLLVNPSARFEGRVIADAGATDVLELAGTSATALAGIGTEFANFHAIGFAAGAEGTLAGNIAGLATGATIFGLTAADAIILDNFSATSETFVTGTGLILGSGAASETIGITGSFSTANFSLSADGTTGTRIRAVAGSVAGTGTLQVAGGGSYTMPGTLTNIGTVVIDDTAKQSTSLTLAAQPFLTAIGGAGSDTITAMAAQQTLTGGPGIETLIGYAGFGDTFLDSSAWLNDDTIKYFGGSDLIDITNLGTGATTAYSGSTSAGTLSVSVGGLGVVDSITFTAGSNLTALLANVSSDGHGGLYIG